MQIKFNKSIKDVLGREVTEGNLGWACSYALATAGGSLPPEKKYQRGLLAMRISAAGTKALELTAEEVSEVKAAVGESFQTGLVAPIWLALEGK